MDQQTEAIEKISTWRTTNHNDKPKKNQKKLTPEIVEKSKRMEDIKNAMTYPGESDPLEE